MDESFVFILDLVNVEGSLPVEVAPGHFFQKANKDQVAEIRKILLQLVPAMGLERQMVLLSYEGKAVEVPGDEPGSVRHQLERLPEEDWRYWVISFQGANYEIREISWAASLLEHNLELGFTVLGTRVGPGGTVWYQTPLNTFFDDLKYRDTPPITMHSNEIREIAANYQMIKQIASEHEYVKTAFVEFENLRLLPRYSGILIIGLFSIIESLVTHCPKLTESSDSLMHQIRTKIPLLRKRFARELPPTTYFGGASEETVWARLYDLRSKIVHGERWDFRGPLQMLRDKDTSVRFLRETVKLLLLLALKEPALLEDLKRC
jgi:hypothetical protein